ncbi:28S ribosomal protein S22, mitochondrial [Ceratina calcarata]|uniref:28S ribosomal protein S22, mitochondrial n=1 Tax=Ceratina calcarata TaxID=156304 RepID=A0AAJ7NCR9_9HYME|nr:28S ribosomal protein S22, mitochondrial [Ceratina calcarata]
MMSSRVNFALRRFYKRATWDCRPCSTASGATNERDPAPIFFDRYVQQLLTTLTRIDYRKVFAARKDGTKLDVPTMKFMTDEELEKARAEIEKKAKGRIQMPPYVKARSDQVQLISDEPAVQGYSEQNFVFTDISFGSNNRERLIVVREANGILRRANTFERHRMNQTYFPIEGREIHHPQMFFSPYIDELLDKGEFEFILDRACLQFEPDDPEYQRVTKLVYSYVNKLNKFDVLRSTRHFGPLAFHLAWEDNIHTLLLDLIRNEAIDEAAALVRLYHRAHPEAKSAAQPTPDNLETIRQYAVLDAPDRLSITRSLDIYERIYAERQKIEEGLQKAHGIDEDGGEEPKT